MTAPAPPTVPVGPDTLITVKVIVDKTNRRFKLALRDVGAHVLPQKLRVLLAIPAEAGVVFERFSDSAEDYVELDSNNSAVYKQLYRAAKAKLKLRIRATIVQPPNSALVVPGVINDQHSRAEPLCLPTPPKVLGLRHSYLDTVLSTPSKKDQQVMPAKPCYAPTAVDVTDTEGQATVTSPRNAAKATVVTSKPLAAAPATNKAEKSAAAQKDLPLKPTARPNGDQRGRQDFSYGTFSIDCNSCGKSVPDAHYHCSICDDGDFDLCALCIAADVTCEGEGHWLIKRRIEDGRLISSVTETIEPKKPEDSQAAESEKQDPALSPYTSRTCNSCINEITNENMVTCTHCADYDLCTMCFSLGDHGHHPGHRFHPLSAQLCKISPQILSLCEPGRGIAHAAICDGCDENIFGVRHKCLRCPDWDYCSNCISSAPHKHPGHRFAPLFQELADVPNREGLHYGIYCDGLLCASMPRKQYIRGIRYKCSVCHDTDFCANCEAVPLSGHNPTHPLIKFKTPVRHVSVTTVGEMNNGQSLPPMGDRPNAKNAATETVPVTSAVSPASARQASVEDEAGKSADRAVVPDADTPKHSEKAVSMLQAHFESDVIPDGSEVSAQRIITQGWTLRNPGPQDWPAGCAVHFTGGDHMLNVDTKNPSSVRALIAATKGTVVDEVIKAGESASFYIVLKSPDREGRAISYWRLKTPDGMPFGHKLWVDVNVQHSAKSCRRRLIGLDEVDTKEEKESKFEEGIQEEGRVKDEEISCMIFPKLEKESPVSSVHVMSKAGGSDADALKLQKEAEDLCEDLEHLDFEDEEETDDGFLTDEEYDILDASDEDLMMEAQKAAKK